MTPELEYVEQLQDMLERSGQRVNELELMLTKAAERIEEKDQQIRFLLDEQRIMANEIERLETPTYSFEGPVSPFEDYDPALD